MDGGFFWFKAATAGNTEFPDVDGFSVFFLNTFSLMDPSRIQHVEPPLMGRTSTNEIRSQSRMVCVECWQPFSMHTRARDHLTFGKMASTMMCRHMGVSRNGGIPIWMAYKGKSY